jgi:hypothetical protein
VKPVVFSRTTALIGAGTFAGALLLYGSTLAPTVAFVDSGELTLAAYSGGVAHPPGFPLYVLLAHLATLIPIGDIAVRVNFASAAFAALTCALVGLIVFHATRAGTAGPEQGSSPDAAKPTLAPAVLSGLLLACSHTLWAYATVAEVYTLNAAISTTVWLLLIRWRHLWCEAARRGNLPPDRLLYNAAIVFGLGLGVHLTTMGLLLPAMVAFVVGTMGRSARTLQRVLLASATTAAAAVAVYAYLPLAASRQPLMNWGNPNDWQRLLWHVTGRQYQGFLSFSGSTAISELKYFLHLAAGEFGPPWAPIVPTLAGAGLAVTYRRDRPIFWFLVLIVVFNVGYSISYPIAEDKDAYYLPTFMAMTIAAGLAVSSLLMTVQSLGRGSLFAWAVVMVSFVAVPAMAFAANLPYNDRRNYFLARDYVDNLLRPVAANGLLLTGDWQVYSPILYLREVEHRRRDVVVIDVNQLRRSWYFDYLRQAFPQTLERSRDRVDAYVGELRRWEQNPALYQRDAALTRRLSARYYAMLSGLIEEHMRLAPVYVTVDLAVGSRSPDPVLTAALLDAYHFKPQLLVFEIAKDAAFRAPAVAANIDGLADRMIRFRNDDVVVLKVRPVYVSMLYNSGRYLADNGRLSAAINSFQQALALEPQFDGAREALSKAVAASGEAGGAAKDATPP